MKTLLLCLLPLVVSAAEVERSENIKREFHGVRTLVVENISGFIHVTPSAGDSLQAEIAKRITADTAELAEQAKNEVKLEISEQGGTVRFHVEQPEHQRHHDGDRYHVRYDFELRVPRRAALTLNTVNGAIDVREVTGDFQLSSVNGPIAIRDTEGAGSLRTVNGKLEAWFKRNPQSPCSFRTVNGRIETWFQPDLAADVQFKTLNGGVYTDFEATGLPVSPQSGERRGAKYVYRSNRSGGVRIGKGGTELRYETVNGEIQVRSRG
jgi:hypothetical protein